MYIIYSSTGEEFSNCPLTQYQAAVVIAHLSIIKPYNHYHMSPVLF